jgi:hypothetical protein
VHLVGKARDRLIELKESIMLSWSPMMLWVVLPAVREMRAFASMAIPGTAFTARELDDVRRCIALH